jgi:hypothetical protein
MLSLLFPLILPLIPSVASQQPNTFGLVGPQNTMLFLNGFHFISGHPEQSVQANHHCTINGPVFVQCIIYIPGTNPARIAGVEYIIPGDAFAKLPLEERQLWHSHQYEVSSGQLIEPGMPDSVDSEIMKVLVNSYGKTFHTWPYESKNNSIPLGIPELVNGFTGNGQLPAKVVAERDRFFGVNSSAISERRKAITPPPVHPGADVWKEGIVLKLALTREKRDVPFKAPA